LTRTFFFDLEYSPHNLQLELISSRCGRCWKRSTTPWNVAILFGILRDSKYISSKDFGRKLLAVFAQYTCKLNS